MGRVCYPFRVKANGRYYAPGEVFEVEDTASAAAQGATVVTDEPEEHANGPVRRGRPKKTEAGGGQSGLLRL